MIKGKEGPIAAHGGTNSRHNQNFPVEFAVLAKLAKRETDQVPQS
jgi:hypothetical protein